MSDAFDDDAMYCVYCGDEAPRRAQIFGCCGEVHFMSGKEMNEKERELDEIDRQMKFMHQEKQYDPPMTQTEEYLLKKQREEEHKSYDY